jgi:hypothetical protein
MDKEDKERVRANENNWKEVENHWARAFRETFREGKKFNSHVVSDFERTKVLTKEHPGFHV